jgi:hypothetical protein
LAWGGGAELDPALGRLWRGQVLNRGSVLGASAWAWAGSFWLDWDNYVGLSADEDPGKVAETDLGLSYGTELFGVFVIPCATAYFFPATGERTQLGLGVGLSYPLGLVSLATNHAMDDLTRPLSYSGDIGVEFQVEGLDRVTTSASAGVGWSTAEYNASAFNTSYWGLDVASLEVGLEYRPLDWLYVKPHALGTVVLGRGLRQAAAETQATENLVAGIAVGVELSGGGF